jgi:hypothetical protein
VINVVKRYHFIILELSKDLREQGEGFVTMSVLIVNIKEEN